LEVNWGKPMRNQKGLSAVQMIVGLGLMGGLLMATMNLVNTQQKLGKSSAHEFELIYLADDIRNLLSNPVNCRASFKGRNSKRATITALKKVVYPRAGEKKKEIITVYQTYDVSQQKYGQENIIISEITIERDFNANILSGTSILKVTFDKGPDSMDETDRFVTRRIKLFVTTSSNSSITSCYTSRGIGLSSSHLPSNQAWTTTPNSTDIYYAGGNVAIGAKDFSNTLVLGGALQLKGSSLPCTIESNGSFYYNKSKESLEVCFGRHKKWRPLTKGRTILQKRPTHFQIELPAGTDIGEISSQRKFKICYLSSPPKTDGHCEVIGSADSTWTIKAKNISPNPLNCKMTCHN
jgi:hypothetical protein